MAWPPRPDDRSSPDVGASGAAASARAHGLIGLAVLVVAAVVIGVVVVSWLPGDEQPRRGGDGQLVEGPRRGDTFFVDPAGEFTLVVPSGFRPISMRGDLAGVSARQFPNDEYGAADALDRLLAAMPRSVVLVAPYTPSLFGEYTVTVTVERVDDSAGAGRLGDIVSGGTDLVPHDVTVEDVPQVVALPAGDALRVEYADPQADAELVRWYVPADDVVWVLTFRAGDLAEFGGFVDVVAASFDLLGPGGQPEPAGSRADPSTGLVPVPAPDGSFMAALPAGWVYHVVGSGSPPVHEQLFPDDADASGRLQDFVATLTNSETRMVAVDPEGWTVIPHRVAVFDQMPGVDPRSSTFDELIEEARQAWVDGGGLLAGEGHTSGAAGAIGVFNVGLPGGALNGIRYVVPGPTSVWVVTAWSDDPNTRPGLDDGIATSFAPA